MQPNQYSPRTHINANVGKNLIIGVGINAGQKDRNYPRDSAARIRPKTTPPVASASPAACRAT